MAVLGSLIARCDQNDKVSSKKFALAFAFRPWFCHCRASFALLMRPRPSGAALAGNRIALDKYAAQAHGFGLVLLQASKLIAQT
jgi:hypothetical protein